jgi:hypothetical protein
MGNKSAQTREIEGSNLSSYMKRVELRRLRRSKSAR